MRLMVEKLTLKSLATALVGLSYSQHANCMLVDTIYIFFASMLAELVASIALSLDSIISCNYL
jgi:hypothetical protein